MANGFYGVTVLEAEDGEDVSANFTASNIFGFGCHGRPLPLLSR